MKTTLILAVLFATAAHGCSSVTPAPDKPCRYAGKAWAVGDVFPDVDGCNTCTCSAQGVGCTTRACLPDASTNDDASQPDATTSDATTPDASDANAGGSCALGTTYVFGQDGGLVAFSDESTLSPPASYVRKRTTFRGGDGPTTMTCAPALPACGTNDVVSLLDITRDLASADVVAAFALTTAPVYGRDARPVDGTVFFVRRADGRTIYVGGDCGAGQSGCVAVPRGVRALADDLTALASQMLAKPECAAFR
ncbi:MAG: hypothetical protein JWM82_1766 [Myxococcales bacterium]|nr:hypothetical protein [Myxococcales bacterium]